MSDQTYMLTVPLFDYNKLLEDSKTLKELQFLIRDIEIKSTPSFKPLMLEDYRPPEDYIADDSFKTRIQLARVVNMIRNRS